MAATQGPPRPYAAAHFALELDGKDEVGLFKSVEGGSIKTDVMTYQHGGDFDRCRQLGKPKFEDIKLQVGLSMSKPFYSWIEGFFKRQVERKTGSIIAADFYYNERARRNFRDAIIKEVVFPKLGGEEKGAIYMNVTLAVEDIVFEKASPRKLKPAPGFDEQRIWSSNNFRFRLDGLGKPCTQCTKIDSFTIKQNVIEYHGGGFRAPIKVSSQVEYPNLVFYVPELDAQPFYDHFHKRGVKGEVPGRLTGFIQTFDNSPAKKNLFTLSFAGADIVNVAPEKSDAGSEDMKLVKIEIYTEVMELKYH
jgi:phage tail-like protein